MLWEFIFFVPAVVLIMLPIFGVFILEALGIRTTKRSFTVFIMLITIFTIGTTFLVEPIIRRGHNRIVTKEQAILEHCNKLWSKWLETEKIVDYTIWKKQC